MLLFQRFALNIIYYNKKYKKVNLFITVTVKMILIFICLYNIYLYNIIIIYVYIILRIEFEQLPGFFQNKITVYYFYSSHFYSYLITIDQLIY